MEFIILYTPACMEADWPSMTGKQTAYSLHIHYIARKGLFAARPSDALSVNKQDISPSAYKFTRCNSFDQKTYSSSSSLAHFGCKVLRKH